MVLRHVPSDCTVVGIPGRIVYRSGVKVNPLEHGSLPDSEATVIRTLLDRIEALEEQVQTLQGQQQPDLVTAHRRQNHKDSCRLSDREIQQYLDGAGI